MWNAILFCLVFLFAMEKTVVAIGGHLGCILVSYEVLACPVAQKWTFADHSSQFEQLNVSVKCNEKAKPLSSLGFGLDKKWYLLKQRSPVGGLLAQYRPFCSCYCNGPIARFAAFKLDPSLIQVKPNARFKHEQITGRRNPQYNGAPTQPDWTKLDYQFRLRADICHRPFLALPLSWLEGWQFGDLANLTGL